MDYRRFGNAVVIRIDRNEEVMEKLEEVCVKEISFSEASPALERPTM